MGLVGVRQLLHHLQEVCGEIYVAAIAFGLAMLDYTYFISLRIAAAMARWEHHGWRGGVFSSTSTAANVGGIGYDRTVRTVPRSAPCLGANRDC